jgi:hypothetical protein
MILLLLLTNPSNGKLSVMKHNENGDTLEVKAFINRWYFDTSALNYLVDHLNNEDCVVTRQLISRRKKQWIISPLNLYEIFGTSDEHRREYLIYKLSLLLPRPGVIFDTPTRILFGIILNYRSELTQFEQSLRDTWFGVVSKGHSFELDYSDFRSRRKVLRMITKAMNFVLRTKTCIVSDTDNVDSETRSILEHLKLFSPPEDGMMAQENDRFYVTTILILAIFCFGVEPDLTFIDEYWVGQRVNQKLKDHLCLSRFEHIMLNHGEVLFESPEIKMMVDFILLEGRTKGINRGTLSDALHLIYSFHACFFVTSDNSILDFAKQEQGISFRFKNTKEFSFQGPQYFGRNPVYKIYYFLKSLFWKEVPIEKTQNND